MLIMCVPLVELLCQVVMGWMLYSSICCQARVGHVAMSCRAKQYMSPLPKTLALGKIYAILKAPGWNDWMPGSVPGRGGRR
jgi:hypothetical protein